MFPFLILHYLLFMYSQRSMLNVSTVAVNVSVKTSYVIKKQLPVL